MKTRLITAFVALPLLVLSIVSPWFAGSAANWVFVVIAGAALGAGLAEFYLLSKKLELKADPAAGYLGAAALFAAFAFDLPAKAPDLMLLTIALFLMVLLVTQMFRFQVDFAKMLTGVGVTLLGVFYVVFLGGFLVSIRVGFENSPGLSTKLLLFFFMVIFGADSGAYFGGRAFGKHKLAPKISPGKTVEGLIGGILAAIGFAALASFWFFPELPYKFSMPLAAVMAIVSVLGDLAESAMKRGAGTKDAANILPGHGGLLDRLDSLLFNAPILYYFARFYF